MQFNLKTGLVAKTTAKIMNKAFFLDLANFYIQKESKKIRKKGLQD